MKKLSAALLLFVALTITSIFTIPGTASALDFNSISAGVTTSSFSSATASDFGVESIYKDVTLDFEVDAYLIENIPVIGAIGVDAHVSYGTLDLDDLPAFTEERITWDATIFAAPWEYVRIGPKVSVLDDEVVVALTLRAGLF
ncbi:MAG: hypothetical protein KAR06_11170 [Deltaproteobacteria bacterium]|nr:hypothetical protein [Deltaproteobacteria bacterium]